MKNMKHLSYVSAILIIIVFFGSCKDEDKEDIRLEVSTDLLDFTSDATSQSFSVTANVEWMASSEQGWCTLSPQTGNGNSNVTVTVQKNTSTNDRSTFITVTDTRNIVSRDIEIIQAGGETDGPSPNPGGDILKVDDSPLDFLSSGGAQTVNITANVVWTAVSSDQTWLTVSPSSGTGNSIVNVTATENTGLTNRVGQVTFKQNSGTATAVLTVNQAGKEPEPQPAGVFYVSNTLGNDSNDGLSWNTSKKTISAAIYIANAGDQIWIDDATYQEQFIPKAGVNMYGGFDRSEKNIAERKSKTMLLREGVFQRTALDTPTVLDGFTITSQSTLDIKENLNLNNCEITDSGLAINGATVSYSTVSNSNLSISEGGRIINSYITTKELRAVTAGPQVGINVRGDNSRIEGCIIKCSIYFPNYKTTDVVHVINVSSGKGIDIVNCTIQASSNSTSYSYLNYVIFSSVGTTVNVANCIVLPFKDQIPFSSGPYVTNSISTKDCTTGRDNIQLTQENLYYLNSDLSLKSNSPAVNGGDNSFVTVETDILGNPRISNGKVDIGAIESSY